MREILFRGKREDNREWVYGYLNRHPSPVQIGDYNNPWTIHVPPADPDDNGGVYWVDPATIGQYTGLTDKNGVKIFEGDIVKCETIHMIGVVVYERGRFAIDEVNNGFQEWEDWEGCEVVGSIHDNSELLSKED